MDHGQAERISFSQCNLTSTLICILGLLLPDLQKTKNFLNSSEILTIGPRTLNSSFADGHSTSPRVTVPPKPRLTDLKTQKFFFNFFFVLSILISSCLLLTSIFFCIFLIMKMEQFLIFLSFWAYSVGIKLKFKILIGG